MLLRPQIPEVAQVEPSEDELSIVQYFGFFSKEDILQETGRLLMLDIDFGRECSLRCPTCFRRKNTVDDSVAPDLTFDELLDVISEARKIGLREIKICGAGEPLENPNLLRLARQLTEWKIGLSIFTKGHVLGSDEMAARIFAHEGVRTAKHLASLLFELKTSMLVSFQSFRSEVQDRLVGNIRGYTVRRNKAVNLLANTGFNKCLPTRMAFCSNPITRQNYDEILDIYVYCRKRNILPITAMLMVSGKQLDGAFLEKVDVSDEKKLDLFTSIYKYNIDTGIQTLETITDQGISPMPGIHVCNQVATGLYITCNGNITSCPGDSKVIGNVRDKALSEIWYASDNYKRNGIFNCWCPLKAGKTLPNILREVVLQRLSDEYSTVSAVSKDVIGESGVTRHHGRMYRCGRFLCQ